MSNISFTDEAIYVLKNLTNSIEVFDRAMSETVHAYGRRSVFSMIKDEKHLSSFIAYSLLLSEREVIKKALGDVFAKFVDYIFDLVIREAIMEEIDRIERVEAEREETIFLPVMSVVNMNENGSEELYRSAFDAEFKKRSCIYAFLRPDAIIVRGRKMEAISSMSVFQPADGAKFDGRSVSICIYYVNIGALLAAMARLSCVRKTMYSEKLIL